MRKTFQGIHHTYEWFWCGTCNCAAIKCSQCNNTSCNGGGCDMCNRDFELIIDSDKPNKDEVPFHEPFDWS